MHSRIIFSLCFISVLIGQTTFTEHTISTSADGAHNAYAEDVDGDGDMDVLSASMWGNEIAWYENDGSENFTEHAIYISDSNSQPWSVHPADLDGDGDMDVISAFAVSYTHLRAHET